MNESSGGGGARGGRGRGRGRSRGNWSRNHGYPHHQDNSRQYYPDGPNFSRDHDRPRQYEDQKHEKSPASFTDEYNSRPSSSNFSRGSRNRQKYPEKSQHERSPASFNEEYHSRPSSSNFSRRLGGRNRNYEYSQNYHETSQHERLANDDYNSQHSSSNFSLRGRNRSHDHRHDNHENSSDLEHHSRPYQGLNHQNRWGKNRKKGEKKNVDVNPDREIQEKSPNLNDGVWSDVAVGIDNLSQDLESNTINDVNRNKASKTKHHQSKKRGNKSKDVNLRSKLTDQLMRGTQECMVCLDKVKQHQATWDCRNCYQVFHIGCIRKWAKSATVESGWRCPGCQVVVESLPREYRCFCRKVLNPDWNRNEGLVPHSCGEVCGRPLAEAGSCPHTCLDLCHPGPCSPCTASVLKTCPCGSTSKRVKCEVELVCDNVCNKMLSCGLHKCQQTCHYGPCGDCQLIINQVCFCGQNSRDVVCGSDLSKEKHFTCGGTCGKMLDCGIHTCQDTCHDGPCSPCPFTPARVTHCPCGKSTQRSLISQGKTVERTSCTDAIGLCDSICDKMLSCGPPSSPHSCKSRCHTGECPPCPLTTSVRCRCGGMDTVMDCTELTTRADDARCQRRCQKKRSCGRHKCGETCCIRVEHPCPLLCNKLLSCKLHYCQENCHTGNCKTCYNVSFDELRCHCGASVLYPPIPCGTRPPECREVCRRHHPCGHPVNHNCHSEAQCPPCATLTTKLCYGGHEMRKNVPCLVEGVSCGKTCGKDLACGNHKCLRICHEGSCADTPCTQPCTVTRPCGHICGARCHTGPCPDLSCSTQVKITCDCGRRQTSISCSDNIFSKLSTSLLASQMADLRSGNSVDLAELAKKNRKLECNEECMKIARNAKLAEALNLDNPELSSKVIPRYSEFMKDWLKKDSQFCTMVYTKIAEVVKLAKESKQKSRSFSFPIMNRDKRQFVHEYASHFGCESQSYDAEPKRNVVVTAIKDRSAIPSITLQESVTGQKKAPTPLLDTASDSRPTFTTLTKTGSDSKIDWFG